MSGQLVISSILSLVPQWYQANVGPKEYRLQIGRSAARFFSHINLTPEISKLKEYAESKSDKLLSFAVEFPHSVAVDLIQEFLALKWLELIGPHIFWKRGLAYFRELSERTYENCPVTKNLIITKLGGNHDITESRHSKVIDPLATSPQVYIKVDGQFRFCDYCEVKWGEVTETLQYKFHPEFLHPYFCVLKRGEFSMHKTARNDFIIMSPGGVIATKRHGRWKFYDTNTLKNSLYEILSNYRIACNLYEVILDLSFRRHGALLVYDPEHKTLNRIANPHSLMSGIQPNPASAHGILNVALRKINVRGWNDEKPRMKRVFLELAGLDGAVIFDARDVLAFGAMIQTHPNATNQQGARTTAALSAYHWGALPVKVSADGEAKCYFTSISKDQERCSAVLDFA